MAQAVIKPRPPERVRRIDRGERIARLDHRFAWVTTLLPLIGSLAAVGFVFYGLAPGAIELAIVVGMYTLVTGAQEIGWHRYFAHRSFEAARPVQIAFAALGSMAFQGPLIWWVATHRRHHECADGPGDPHSPYPRGPGWRGRARGFVEGHSGWTFDAERARPEGWSRYAKDLYRDPLLFRIHYRYFTWMLLSLLIPAALGGLAHGSAEGALLGLLWGGFVRIFVSDHFVRALNSVAHTFGSRSFETGEQSRNNFWLVFPTFGQGWHHNHHAFPRAALTGLDRWQIDPGGWVIRALERLGLVWNVKQPSRALIESRRIGNTVTSADPRAA